MIQGKLMRIGWMILGENGEPQDDDRPDTQERFCAIVEFPDGPPSEMGPLMACVWGNQEIGLEPSTRSVAETRVSVEGVTS